ncbi:MULTISPECIES: glycosyl transferase family protein [Spongiibacter]|uniref:glycosyl transferase family protein n=1 Tax=Spongiibacter TaxID=630749 RepID=UPI000C5A3057|nr:MULTISPECIES: glycosyl transferase family protein [Spongiibacter]MAY37503.1 glycosyl transferase [Spongiibacter sp.]MBI59489.1 glycosyl transferase [Spongiibacter sp.]|tara:strand:+ start:17142 stop:18128 length:987 start_codon:yes stop_codon:yes gene_type:complete
MSEHPFAPYVRILGKGKTGSRSLSMDEAYAAMNMIVRGEVEDVQLGAFLMLLRVKEESPEELAGFVRAVRDNIPAPTLSVDLDWASYAGKRRQQAWYLLAALALADSGLRVVMHGAAGHTEGRFYSEQLLASLGETVVQDWQQCSDALDQRQFCYVPLSLMSPPLQRIIALRNHFGLRSPVHSLARLLNPFRAEYSIQSIFHPAYAESHQQAAALLEQPHAVVFKGEAGEAERKPEAICRTHSVHCGALGEQSWPKLIEGRQAWQEEMSSAPLRAAWRNDEIDDYGRQAIIGTIAIALQLRDSTLDQHAAMNAAADVWASRNRQRIDS